MLKITNLHAGIEGNEILKGIDLEVKPGEVHAIMGPNGSGKSTLAQVLAGREEYEVSAGEVSYEGKNLLELEPEDPENHRAMARLLEARGRGAEAEDRLRKALELDPSDPTTLADLGQRRLDGTREL